MFFIMSIRKRNKNRNFNRLLAKMQYHLYNKTIREGIPIETKDKIKQQRLHLGLTMLDVSKIVGVSEATISRWESGDIANMKRDKIVLLAKALQVSPNIIMGWGEDSDNDLINNILTKDQQLLINRYQQLNEKGQQKLLEYADDLVSSSKYQTETKITTTFYRAAKSKTNTPPQLIEDTTNLKQRLQNATPITSEDDL